MGTGTVYAVEYSATQDCFHVDALDHVLHLNQQNALHKKSNDYEIICICDSMDRANEVCKLFRSQQIKETSNRTFNRFDEMEQRHKKSITG